MSYKPTDEQTAIIDACTAGKKVVIEAGAGTGKTSTLRLASAQMRGTGLYLAYNKAIQLEAQASFPKHVECRTAHSMAYRAVGKDYAARLRAPRQPARQAARLLQVNYPVQLSGDLVLQPTQLTRLALDTVSRFCQSAGRDILPRHVPRPEGVGDLDYEVLQSAVLPLAKKAWADLQRKNGSLKFDHDHYLKLWQLQGPRLDYDFVLFDEAQDANPVIESIVQGQDRHAQLIAVGDGNQQLYGFRGAVDALARWQADERLYLSQSWRFGQAVADEANRWLAQLGAKLRLIGAPGQDSVVGPIKGWPDAILARTNAEAVRQAMAAMDDDKRVALVGGAGHIVRLAEACEQLQDGKGTTHPELFAFNTWGEVQDYVEHDAAGADLRTFVNLIDDHGPATIIQAMAHVQDDTGKGPRPDVVVSTAHKAKGREWARVTIADDFKEPTSKDGEPPKLAKADGMVAYVAVTRARKHLDRGGLAWIDNLQPTPA